MDTLTSPLTVGSHVKDVVVEGQIVLMDLHRDLYLGLDELGTKIWRLIREARTGETITECLAQEYAVEELTLREDVSRFIADLMSRRLVACSPSAATGTQ